MTDDQVVAASKVSGGAVEPFDWFGTPRQTEAVGTNDPPSAETEGTGTESTSAGGRGRGGGFNNYGSQEAAQVAIARFLAESRLTPDARAEQTADRRWRIVPAPSRSRRRQLG
jgi:hypothetical protein